MKKTQIVISLLVLTPISFAQNAVPTTPPVPATYDESCLCRNDRTKDGRLCGLLSAFDRDLGFHPACDKNGNRITTVVNTNQATTSQTEYDSNRTPDYCPAASAYNIPSGYRLAGISPSCQAVVIPMSNGFSAKDPDEVD